MDLLHILNGDSTGHSFGGTGLPGKRAVWREALCEGRITQQPAPRAILQERAGLFPGYDEAVLAEWDVIAAHRGPVILWFEFDLFCQINLLFLVSYLPEENPLFLICPGDHPEIPGFRGLGECNARQLAELYLTRVPLSETDRLIARQLWHAYAGPDPQALSAVRETGAFHHAPAALALHLQRFPSIATGLNNIEAFFLERILLAQSGLPALLHQFWETFPGFGFGDTQLKALLDDLVRYGLLACESGHYTLTPTGNAVREGTVDYVSFWDSPRWLGGCELAPGAAVPRWNTAERTISLPAPQ